ncbi:MAG: aspartate/glutamate racemase family protein [Deltaproteobacteria bacterium]|nr:aspartate/glutamate racemase family protein [Deltaproteobacteria bacterium]
MSADATIVVTDSGLGGLSTMAELYRRLASAKAGSAVQLIFVNALADYALGYNAMKTVEQKVAVFNNVLAAMSERYQPDSILIACNTLSVIYPETAFAKSTCGRVVGIVETGVTLLLEFLRADSMSQAIILGTETTIQSGTYPLRLAEAGIAPTRIVAEACGKLMMEIERDAVSAATKELIAHHARRAVARLPRRDVPTAVSLNCTHYGYAEALFHEAFRAEGIALAACLNPNARLAEAIPVPPATPSSASDISAQVVSQVALEPESIASTARLLEPIAPPVAAALRAYTHIPDLFAW